MSNTETETDVPNYYQCSDNYLGCWTVQCATTTGYSKCTLKWKYINCYGYQFLSTITCLLPVDTEWKTIAFTGECHFCKQ